MRCGKRVKVLPNHVRSADQPRAVCEFRGRVRGGGAMRPSRSRQRLVACAARSGLQPDRRVDLVSEAKRNLREAGDDRCAEPVAGRIRGWRRCWSMKVVFRTRLRPSSGVRLRISRQRIPTRAAIKFNCNCARGPSIGPERTFPGARGGEQSVSQQQGTTRQVSRRAHLRGGGRHRHRETTGD